MVKKGRGKTISKWYDPIILYILFPIVTSLLKLLLFSYRLVRVEGANLEKEAIKKSGGKIVSILTE